MRKSFGNKKYLVRKTKGYQRKTKESHKEEPGADAFLTRPRRTGGKITCGKSQKGGERTNKNSVKVSLAGGYCFHRDATRKTGVGWKRLTRGNA